MSVTTEQTRLVAGPALLPRVNLLPPEIAEERTFRKVRLGLGTAVVVAVGAVGGLYLLAAHGVARQQDRLDVVTAAHSRLQAKQATYRDVTKVYAQAADAEKMLTVAMSDEVRYSQLLNALSLTVPAHVWLKSMTYTSGATAGAAAAGQPADVGTLSVNGVASSHDDVAAWLDALGGQSTYRDSSLSNSTEVPLGRQKIVNFSSTATVTSAARSGRYTTGTKD